MPIRRFLAALLAVVLAVGAAGLTAAPAAAAPSTSANLSALSISAGTLSPAFASGTTEYTASVGNATTWVYVIPTIADGAASVAVNGVTTTSGNATGAIFLDVGANTITTLVTAQDGTTRTYTVTVTRGAPANADLSSLSLSAGTLSPGFASGTTSYTASISAGTSSLTVAPTAAASTSSVTVNGVSVTSGAASGSIAMNPGSNTVTVVVTAQEGMTKTYTITVTKALPSSDANLAALSLSAGTLGPVFATGTTSYTAAVTHATTALTVTPTVADATATATVNGVATPSGNASDAIALAVGANTITVVVSAQDGTTSKSYTTTVTRAGSANSTLSALVPSGASLSPVFEPSTSSYTATVATTVASIAFTPTVAEPNATVTVDGVAVASGASSGALPLGFGANTVTVVVTAQSGAVTSYSVTVTRALPSNDADLAGLSLSDATISPTFDPSTTGYVASVANSVSTVTVTTTAAATATVTINGGAGSNVPLAVGSNTITVRVTAEDAITTTDYVITVSRAFVAPGFTDATLGAMQVGVAFADSVAAAGTPVISYSVTSGALPAGLALDPATGAVAGTPTLAGPFDVTISATSPYAAAVARITGTVLAAPVVPPVLPAPIVELVPGFTAGTPLTQATLSVTGANLVPGSKYSIVLYSDPVLLADGVIDQTGTLSYTATLPAEVEAGAHRLVLTVVAPDGAVVSDTVWFTVLAGGTIGAVSLEGAVAYIAPAATSVLAATGVDQGFASTTALLSALALAAGLALMLVQRRRFREVA